MNKVYNTFDNISINLQNFFKECNLSLSKPNIANLSYIIEGIILSESVVTSKIATNLKSNFLSTNDESNQKKVWRFFNNDKIDIYKIYDEIISNVINNISNVKADELIVTLDHMFTKNNFVTLMFTLKIDKQGIPLTFTTERTLSNCHQEIQKNSRKKIFSEELIIQYIDKVIELLAPLNKKIIFLADRWFFNLKLLKHIDEKGHYYCFRAKAKSSVKVFLYNNDGEIQRKNLIDLKPTVYHSKYYKDIEFGDMHLKANLTVSRDIAFKNRSKENDDEEIENWYIISNIEPNKALRTYSKRFGLIEMFFKSQKTNGFYLEETKTKNLHAFETLYGVICITSLWLNILGRDYIKNYPHVKNRINIRFNKKNANNKTVRILSTFRLGLKLFKKLLFSNIDFKIKTNFKLYL